MKRIFLIISILALICSCGETPSSHKDWSGSVVYELNVRQLTPEGTFAAAEAHLPRLKELGVDIVWLMPIYPIGVLERKGTLGSYYAIRNYQDVNPEFGTLSDFDHFLAAAHAEGLSVILDWVANHTSPDHPWVTEKPAEWYVRDSLGHTIVEYDWTDIAKLNYDCPDVSAEMENCMRFWLDRGVDGFRCDVAYQLPQSFWTNTIASLREDYGDLYFLAEGEEPWLHEAGFNSTYSWEVHHLMNDIAQGRAGLDSLKACIDRNLEKYPAPAMRLTFTSNHDENSWSGSDIERLSYAWKAMSLLCFTLPGAQPLIYTAQEMGYDHRFQFFEKDPVPADLWTDEYSLEYYTDWYKELCQLYHSHPALWAGNPESKFEWVDDDPFDDEEMLVFRRYTPDDSVIVRVHLQFPWEYNYEIENQ